MMVRGVVTRMPTVFLVDEDAHMRRSLCQLLENRGFHVESFIDPPEFFKHYDRDRPGCLVLDCELSGNVDRDTECCLLEWCQRLPVVVISADAEVQYVVSAFKAGVHDFLVKPLQTELFVATVGQAVRRDEEHRRNRETVERLRPLFGSLSENEWRVLKGIVDGRTSKRIANELGKSPKTVEYYRKMIMAKLSINSVAELVRAYLRVFPEEPTAKYAQRQYRHEPAGGSSSHFPGNLDASRRS
ncbi:MAG: response regulator [Planctomycetota bacterium]